MSTYNINDDLLKLRTLRELPKSRYATNLAVTVYPNSRRGRKAVFSHIEVYKMTENIAGRMRECGVRPGTVCAYALPASYESIIYFYALMWIGAIAAPIDPQLPKDEFEAAIRATGAAVLVSPYEGDDDDLETKAADATAALDLCGWHIHRTINEGVKLETHGKLMGAGAAWAGGAGDFKIDPDEIAVHIASAVAVLPLSHNMLCNAAKSFTSTYGAAITGSTVLAAPLHSVHGILVLISLFYFGGHVVLPGHGGFTPERFWELSKKHNVTWLSSSEDQALELYEDVKKSNISVSALPKLEFIRVSGQAAIAAEVVQDMEDTLLTKIYESYGPTEASGFATANREDNVKLGSLGTSVKGATIAIFDTETKSKCEPGTDGEIAVCGPSVAQSYLDSPSATEEAIFKTEEPGDQDGETHTVHWFATGDRGVVDEDGYLIVKGNSRTLRAAELALMEERRLKEEAEAENRAKVEAEERSLALAAAEKQRAEEEEAARIAEEEEKEKREKEAAAAAAAAAAATAATSSRALELDEREKKLKEMEALSRMGIKNPEDLDQETVNAILKRLEQIEENHMRLQSDLENRNADELEEMRRRVAEAEEEAASLLAKAGHTEPLMVDYRMEELEAAVMAAAASAESSANNTREAVKAAREVALATQNANRSQPVDIKPSTGDQGALTKTVRVALDEVEKAMEKHPAVRAARAFGRKDKKFGAEVFCAIVPKKGARISEPWLKLFAQSQLAAPMVPKKFYYLNEVPPNMTRRELSQSPLLKDLTQFSGYSESKAVKGPNWKPSDKSRNYAPRNNLGF